jgi:MiaB/RimO family radical SAM methylthiotransferase
MKKRAQIIIKSCGIRELELSQMKAFLEGNGFLVEETFILKYGTLNENEISKTADFIFFSTCAFSNATESQNIEEVVLINKKKKESAELVICGCLPKINPENLEGIFKGKTFGPRSYNTLNDIIGATKKFEDFAHNNITNSMGNNIFAIQIHKGCPCRCSYCAIKYGIGELESTPIEQIMVEFKSGLEQGYKEFFFLGDCVSGYGLDIKETLGTLLQRVIEIDQDFKLYLPDIAPFFLYKCFDELKILARENKIKSMIAQIQSANPRILKLMRRSSNMNNIKDMLKELKNIDPSLHLATSIIIGFPSETMEEVDETIQYCKDVGFDHVFCHGYSERPNVESAKLPGKFTNEQIKERCEYVKSELGEMAAIVTIPGEGGKVEDSFHKQLKATINPPKSISERLNELFHEELMSED